jgi:hypothetical protein
MFPLYLFLKCLLVSLNRYHNMVLPRIFLEGKIAHCPVSGEVLVTERMPITTV